MPLALAALLSACGPTGPRLEAEPDGAKEDAEAGLWPGGDGGVDVDAGSPTESGIGDGGWDVDAGADADDAVTPELPPADPWARGPHAVAESSVQVELEGRAPIRVALFVPDDLSGAPYPVVVYSHGFQLNGSQYATTARHLASHGLVTLLPSYGDSILSPRSHSDLADDLVGLVDRLVEEAGDESSPLHGRIDPAAIGLAGHSRGGKQAALAAIRDPRVGALAGVDAVDSLPPGQEASDDYPSVTPELMDGLLVPSAWIGAGRANSGGFGACAPDAENHHAFFLQAATPAYEYVLPEAGHLDFADGCGLVCFTCAAGADPEWSRSFARATMVAFFHVHLAGDDRYLPWVEGDEVAALSDSVLFTRR